MFRVEISFTDSSLLTLAAAEYSLRETAFEQPAQAWLSVVARGGLFHLQGGLAATEL